MTNDVKRDADNLLSFIRIDKPMVLELYRYTLHHSLNMR